MSWRDEAACADPKVDPAWFFPRKTVHYEHGPEQVEDPSAADPRAIEVCARCPVHKECLAHSRSLPLAQDVGTRAGLSEKERQSLRYRKGGHRCVWCECPTTGRSQLCEECRDRRDRERGTGYTRTYYVRHREQIVARKRERRAAKKAADCA